MSRVGVLASFPAGPHPHDDKCQDYSGLAKWIVHKTRIGKRARAIFGSDEAEHVAMLGALCAIRRQREGSEREMAAYVSAWIRGFLHHAVNAEIPHRHEVSLDDPNPDEPGEAVSDSIPDRSTRMSAADLEIASIAITELGKLGRKGSVFMLRHMFEMTYEEIRSHLSLKTHRSRCSIYEAQALRVVTKQLRVVHGITTL